MVVRDRATLHAAESSRAVGAAGLVSTGGHSLRQWAAAARGSSAAAAGDFRDISWVRAILGEYGFQKREQVCLVKLWSYA